MIGGKYEAENIAEHGTTPVTVVTTVQGTRIPVLIGGSSGVNGCGMCGRTCSLRFPFTWHNRRIGVTGGGQVAGVPATVHRDADRRTPEPAEAFKAPIGAKYEEKGNPRHATARLSGDGTVLPATLTLPVAERAQFGASWM